MQRNLRLALKRGERECEDPSGGFDRQSNSDVFEFASAAPPMSSVLTATACALMVALLAGMTGSMGVCPRPDPRYVADTSQQENRCEFGAVGDGNQFTCNEYRDDEVPFFPKPSLDDEEVLPVNDRSDARPTEMREARAATKEIGQ